MENGYRQDQRILHQIIRSTDRSSNLADLSSQTSMKFAAHAYELLGIPMTKRAGNLDDDSDNSASGPALEKEIETDLKAQLPAD